MEGEEALHALAAELRAEDTVITAHVADPGDVAPALGMLAAAGPRAGEAPGEYALLVEMIREGYLLHYGEPRVVIGANDDLALLTGDYLYALGLERLAALGDLEAVRELSDLISLSAQIHAEVRSAGAGEALWLASVVRVAAGAVPAHEEAKADLCRGDPKAATSLWEGALEAADRCGIGEQLRRTAEAIRFQPH
jgi:hypothetical protein